MYVIDYLKKGYKGRRTWASDVECPCRQCFNAHDCGHTSLNGKHVVRMHCATNYNHGCPDPKPKPRHIVKLSKRTLKMLEKGKVDLLCSYVHFSKCLRCGQMVNLVEADFEIKGGKES